MKRLHLPVLFMVLLVCIGCGGQDWEINIQLIEDSQSSDLQTLTYKVLVKEKQGNCDVENIEFDAKVLISFGSDIDPGKDIFITQKFGSVSKGSKKRKTFTYNTAGREVNPFLAIALRDIDGEPTNCNLL